MCSARLASRLPPRLRRCRTTFPEGASTGETPQRLAKEASLLRRSGLSPATTSRVAAWCVPTAGRESKPGAASATSLRKCASNPAISSERVHSASDRSVGYVGLMHARVALPTPHYLFLDSFSTHSSE